MPSSKRPVTLRLDGEPDGRQGRKMPKGKDCANTTHGMRGTPTYNSWRSARGRCENVNDPAYTRYGGRGIKVCERWLSFENFLADMGVRPDGLSLDRIDNNGHYEPGNCRWATRREQGANMRSNRMIEIDGVIRTFTDWCRHFDIGTRSVHDRVARGESVISALTRPVAEHRRVVVRKYV